MSAFIFPKRGCFIVAKLREGKKSVVSRSVARIFSRGILTVIKIPLHCPSPLKSESYCFGFPSSSAWWLYVVYCLTLKGTNFNRWPWRMFGGVILWAEMLFDEGGFGGNLPRKILKIWTRSNAICCIRDPLRSAFCWQFRSVFDRKQIDEDRIRRGRIAFRSDNRTACRTSYSFWLLQ